ncbi:MAG: hypothetical protein CMD93_02685 [Gammaproteobacteria bacterium]|jgi:hypothetical protein|nr:hypothetical protein [Gammaproteobacteria bacterium]|tara:strand:+ start:3564 stop:3887 length:324 start_codon:yes stop_codon:yes gene_type:complete
MSDTIIGSIIIGVLVGGAIIISGGKSGDYKEPQIKIIKSSLESSNQEKLHEEFITQESNSEIRIKLNSNEITEDLPSTISDSVEEALSKALETLPEDIDVRVEINTK